MALTTRPRDLRSYRFLEILTHVFVVVLLVSNLIAAKMTYIGPFTISAAQALFPITYIFGDVFTEVYGYAASRRAIWIGFLASALLALLGLFAVSLPPAPDFHNQDAYATIFGMVPRAIAASLVAYWAGEFANSYTLAKLKVLTRGRYLWTRTVGSTIVGQAVDSIIVVTILFAGTVPVSLLFKMIGSGYLFKVVYEALATPVTYKVVSALKRAEGVDVFDQGTDFNPFHSGGASRQQG